MRQRHSRGRAQQRHSACLTRVEATKNFKGQIKILKKKSFSHKKKASFPVKIVVNSWQLTLLQWSSHWCWRWSRSSAHPPPLSHQVCIFSFVCTTCLVVSTQPGLCPSGRATHFLSFWADLLREFAGATYQLRRTKTEKKKDGTRHTSGFNSGLLYLAHCWVVLLLLPIFFSRRNTACMFVLCGIIWVSLTEYQQQQSQRTKAIEPLLWHRSVRVVLLIDIFHVFPYSQLLLLCIM